MVENPYLQFPICALSFGETEHARLDAILAYAVVLAGYRLWSKLTPYQQREFQAGAKKSKQIPAHYDAYDWRHPAALYGCHVIGVTYKSFQSIGEGYDGLCDHIAQFVTKHGRDAQVRIKRAWLFDARDGHGLTYREFSVLCGIYSAIGDKELAIVTRDRIRRCALGYRTAAIMQAELPTRTDKAQPLTERQLRDTIERLHRNKFFARCTVARRITYYSIRLDSESIRKKILERRTYADYFHASQSALDQALTTAIKQKRRELFKSSAKAATTPPLTKFTGTFRFPTSN